ncbi:hypothetical protein [Flavobacterium gilvum]|uniref:hypothetical protein n=1 Tax=Flavobacterium gilvum TaxID=1492737 RepID=UPI0004E3FC21|nr:hypothetical protein [Flavobacterium gilvum]KFC58763.1 hypothetical protein FEM08_24960 [Flavobacterium gilvum]
MSNFAERIDTTTDLDNRLNRKIVLYLEDFANPKNGLNLIPNPLEYQNAMG